MKRLIAFTLVAFLTACTTTGAPDPEKTVFSVATAYLGIQQGMASYLQLPRCTQPKRTPICHEQTAEATLQKANKTAETAIDSAIDLVRNHKTINADFAIAAARNAINAIVTILQTYGVTGVAMVN